MFLARFAQLATPPARSVTNVSKIAVFRMCTNVHPKENAVSQRQKVQRGQNMGMSVKADEKGERRSELL